MEGVGLGSEYRTIGLDKNDVPLPPDKKYHVFFSYRDTAFDRDWVRGVISCLEDDHYIKCCDHMRDFIPGCSTVDNISDCVQQSLKIVIVLSKEFHKSDWCKHEAKMFLHWSISSRKEILIPVIIENVRDWEIPHHLRHIVYIDCRGNRELWFQKLLDAIKRDSHSQIQFHHNTNQTARNLDFTHYEQATTTSSNFPYRKQFLQKYLPSKFYSEDVNLDLQTYQSIRKELENVFSLQYNYNPSIFENTLNICIFVFLAFLFLFGFVCFPLAYLEGYDFLYIPGSIILVFIIIAGITYAVVYQKYWRKERGQKSNLHLRTMKMIYIQQKLTVKEQHFGTDVHEVTTESESEDTDREKIQEQAESLLLEESLNYIVDYYNSKLANGTTQRHCKRAICLCEYVERKKLI